MEKEAKLVARYKSGGTVYYVDAAFGGGDDGKVFHLDITSRDFFVGKKPPVTAKISDINKAVSHLEGHKIKAKVDGHFTVQEADLPPIIRAAMVETKADNVTIKAVGGTFFVSGSPIEMIDWFLGIDEEVLIQLSASVSTVIDEEYLESALRLVDSAFETFIRGGRENVRR
jgi:hypothetical protein